MSTIYKHKISVIIMSEYNQNSHFSEFIQNSSKVLCAIHEAIVPRFSFSVSQNC